MNVRRIFRLVAAFALVAAVLILARPAWVVAAGAWTEWKERPDPIVPSDDEFAAIVRAVIEANQSNYGEPPPPPEPSRPIPEGPSQTLEEPKPAELVLEDRSLTLCPDERPSSTDECRPGTEYGFRQRVVSRKWSDELKLANQRSVPVPDLGMNSSCARSMSSCGVMSMPVCFNWNAYSSGGRRVSSRAAGSTVLRTQSA